MFSLGRSPGFVPFSTVTEITLEGRLKSCPVLSNTALESALYKALR